MAIHSMHEQLLHLTLSRGCKLTTPTTLDVKQQVEAVS